MPKSAKANTPAELLQFTPIDLAANRAGQITPIQQARLDRPRRSTWTLFVVAALLFVSVAIASLVADVPTAAFLFGGLGVALLGSFYWSVRHRAEAVRALPLAARQGEASLGRTRRRRTGAAAATVYSLTIDGAEFVIDKELHAWLGAAIAAGASIYTVYYLAGEKRILSLEPGRAALDAFAQPDTVERESPNGAVAHALAILEGRRSVPTGTDLDNTDLDDAGEQATARAQAIATLRAAGPAIIPQLAPYLHKSLYRDLVATMGAQAIAPLMRLPAREGSLIESRLLDSVVGVLGAMPLDELANELPAYLERNHSPAVRMAALRVLGHRRNPQRIRVLQRAAHDPEPAIAARAQQTLARIDQLHGWQ